MGLWDMIKRFFSNLLTVFFVWIWERLSEPFRPKRKPKSRPSPRPSVGPYGPSYRPPPRRPYEPKGGVSYRIRNSVGNGYQGMRNRYRHPYGPTCVVPYPEEYIRDYFLDKSAYRGALNSLYRNENAIYRRKKRY